MLLQLDWLSAQLDGEVLHAPVRLVISAQLDGEMLFQLDWLYQLS